MQLCTRLNTHACTCAHIVSRQAKTCEWEFAHSSYFLTYCVLFCFVLFCFLNPDQSITDMPTNNTSRDRHLHTHTQTSFCPASLSTLTHETDKSLPGMSHQFHLSAMKSPQHTNSCTQPILFALMLPVWTKRWTFTVDARDQDQDSIKNRLWVLVMLCPVRTHNAAVYLGHILCTVSVVFSVHTSGGLFGRIWRGFWLECVLTGQDGVLLLIGCLSLGFP